MGVIRVIDETMLDLLPSVTETSRLSCQIVYRTALDGLAPRLGKTA